LPESRGFCTGVPSGRAGAHLPAAMGRAGGGWLRQTGPGWGATSPVFPLPRQQPAARKAPRQIDICEMFTGNIVTVKLIGTLLGGMKFNYG
jgi:hypothetical protein